MNLNQNLLMSIQWSMMSEAWFLNEQLVKPSEPTIVASSNYDIHMTQFLDILN